MAYHPQRLLGDEQLIGAYSAFTDATVLDFWQWAFSNLRLNNIRGIYAEWLVAKLLNIPQPLRDSWAEWDLLTPENVRIEVKTSAYVQAWSQKGASRIMFGGLHARKLDPESNVYRETSTYNADIYVFCVQIEKDVDQWNALDLNQWRFYALSSDDMREIGFRSISLATLHARCQPMEADDFVTTMQRMIRQQTGAGSTL